MFYYRFRQFIWSFKSKIDCNDIEYVKKILNDTEYNLFSALSQQDQKHSIRVLMDVEKECEKAGINSDELKKAALLHDTGKSTGHLTAIDKAFLVILNKFTRGAIRNIKNSQKIYVYFNHADIGYKILKDAGLNEKTLYLIKNHHNNFLVADVELEILKKCDDRN